MKIESEKGYIFLPKPLNTEQYYIIKEYTQLQYINSYTIGFNEELRHYESCEIFYESLYQNQLQALLNENPTLNYEDALDLMIEKGNHIVAIELATSYNGLELFLPNKMKYITKEEWCHFLTYYSQAELTRYIDVWLSSYPKDIFQNVDKFDTFHNKKRLQTISQIMGFIDEPEKPFIYKK